MERGGGEEVERDPEPEEERGRLRLLRCEPGEDPDTVQGEGEAAAGGEPAGREALLRYVLRPPIAQERLELRPDGLVRITLKKAYTDGTVAVDMDPVSLLCRLATSVPSPRRHTIRYSGVLAPASPWRSSLAPMAPCEAPADGQRSPRPEGAPSYRPWAQLLARTFAVDVLACPKCHGRMRLLAIVEEPANVGRYLAAVGEATEVPARSPGRGPPYWKSPANTTTYHIGGGRGAVFRAGRRGEDPSREGDAAGTSTGLPIRSI